MSEFDDSADMTDELILESAKVDETGSRGPTWHRWVAMSTLVMALFTTIGALLAGITAHEALLVRTEEIIAISIAQNNRTTIEVLKSKQAILVGLGEVPDETEIDQIQANEAAVMELDIAAEDKETGIQTTGYIHLIFVIAVALLAIGTSLCGMAIIAAQKYLWYAGMVFGAIGSMGVIAGVGMMLFP